MEPRVAAITVTYDRPDHLSRLLESLRDQTRPVDAVIVVDNSSRDDVTAVAAAHAEVTLLRERDNSGPAGGFARGMTFAFAEGYDWFLLIGDDDRLAVPDAVRILLDRAASSEHPVMVGSSLVRGREVWPAGGWWKHRPVMAFAHPPRSAEYEVDVTTFSGLLVPRAVFDDVGAPWAELFMSWEDYDFCLRARDRGHRIVILDRPLVEFQAEREIGNYAPWRAYYQARNSLLVLRRRRVPIEFVWWLLFQLKSLLVSVTLDRPAARIAMRLRGIVHGLRGRTGRVVDPSA